MLRGLINEFRAQYGVGPANFSDSQEDQHCLCHCWYMSKIQGCCHAPGYFYPGKAEAVGRGSFYRDTRESVALIIFGEQGFRTSPEHRDILLMPNIACAFCQDNWMVYVTVRGWN